MSAAGGLISTAHNLLRFLAASMGYEPSPLAPAIATMLTTRRPKPGLRQTQALGWVVIGEGDDQVVVHDGGTRGYASSVACDPNTRVGVVVLSNQVVGVSRRSSRPHFAVRHRCIQVVLQCRPTHLNEEVRGANPKERPGKPRHQRSVYRKWMEGR